MPKLTTLLLVTLALSFPTGLSAACPDGVHGEYRLSLPAGEDTAVVTVDLSREDFLDEDAWGDSMHTAVLRLCFRFDNQSDVEFGVFVHGPEDKPFGWIDGRVDDFSLTRAAPNRLDYREVNTEPGRHDKVLLLQPVNVVTAGASWEEHQEELAAFEAGITPVQVTAVLKRLAGRCAMSVEVSGDFDGYYFGDVAYFNTHALGVQEGMMAGTMADEDMHEQMEGFVGMMGAMAEMAEQMGIDTGLTEEQRQQLGLDDENRDDEDYRSPAQREMAEGLEEMLRPSDGGAADNFGLSLAAVKMGPGMEEAAAGAAAAFLSAFTLAISGEIDEVIGDHEGRTIRSLGVSTVQATVGAADGRGAMKFEVEGPDDIRFEITPMSKDWISGSFHANLITDSVYTVDAVTGPNARKLRVYVAAEFHAGRGVLSCLN